jgi:hypothetical protein
MIGNVEIERLLKEILNELRKIRKLKEMQLKRKIE